QAMTQVDCLTVSKDVVFKSMNGDLPPNEQYKNNSCEDTQPIQKHPLSYVALISKCILSSPLQKLNLASIYRAMEEQYPYLRSRGPGWRNSVRHNLSVNDCFVKVSRCENGRGHYWGVHPAHLRHFQQGDYRQHRKARERRERERHNEGTGCWVCSSFLLSGLEPYCFPLEQQRYKMSYFNWTEAHNQLWSGNVGWLQSPNSITQYYFPERTGHVGRIQIHFSFLTLVSACLIVLYAPPSSCTICNTYCILSLLRWSHLRCFCQCSFVELLHCAFNKIPI
uniref:Fork-head domain-containing protein n=1 Tax=Anabas testudineus TaxID=64144 RepID=A0A3Q1J9L2_ANATE